MVKNFEQAEYATVDFDPFAGPEIINVAPATEPQKEIWTSCLLGGESANRAFNESFSVKLTGNLSKEALFKAFEVLILRHESLRSAFSADGQQICIFGDVENPLIFENISQLCANEQLTYINRQALQEALCVLDLLNGPLFKATLLQLSDTDHYLTITTHHIICDGWSFNIVLQELSKLYSAYVQNISADLPAAILYSEYAGQQQIFSTSSEYRQTENYWVNQYKENVPVLNLSTDFPRPALRTYKSKRLDYKIDAELTQALKTLGKKSGTSFVTTLIAAFEVFLHRLTNQDTLVIGLPAAGQAATGQYNLIGHCVNLLPIKSNINNKNAFADYLKQRKKNILDSFEHQQFTFGSLLKKLNISRDASRVALVPVVFNVDMGMNDGVNFYGLTHELISNAREFETFEIFLNISGTRQGLTFEWSYNTQLFEETTISRMMKGLTSVLETIVSDPLIRIENIQLADMHELVEKLKLWNATTAAYDKEKPVHQLISETAGKYPEKVALVFKDKKISYRTLNETANQLAHILVEQEIRPGDIVGVALDRSPWMLISLLAVLKAGAAYIPIDPNYPQDRILYMLEDSAAKIVITSNGYKGKFNSLAKEFLIEQAMVKVPDYARKAPSVQVTGSDLAYILYTSGSTGKPKGVLIEHHNVVNMLQSMLIMPGISQSDILLAVTTISFDIACLEMYLPLITGATIVLADSAVARDGMELLKLVKEQQVSMVQATPATFKMMLAAGWTQQLNLKILCCGEPLSKDLATKLLQRAASLYNMYGPTETTVYSSGKQITNTEEVITIGRPIHNTSIYILDESLNLVPEGATGEIYIAGEGVGRGYNNLPELTAQKFVANPFSINETDKMYRTGDLGKYLSNGEIQCLGRVDQQVKIRGYRIEPSEIEHAIMKAGGIKEALVIARHDTTVHQKLVAYIVCEHPTGSSQFLSHITTLKEKLKKTLPAYMVPDHFINLENIPLLPNGKSDYKSLPPLQTNTEMTAGKAETPKTESEKLVSAIWEEFLELKNIGINNDFFELGGHSLIAVEVMMRIEKQTGVKLPLATLFQYPTIKKLATLLESDKKEISWKSLVPIKPSGSKMPVYIIHGSGLNILNFSSFALHVDPEQPVYGLQAKGLDGSDEPLNDMEEIAAFYVSQVIEHNSQGPYAIAGYSFGGYVANEMARQLRLMGKEVKMLAMFDTNAKEQQYDQNVARKITTKTLRQFKKAGWIATSLVQQPKATIDYQLKYSYNRLKALGVKLRLVKEVVPEGYMSDLKRISEQHDIAYANYKMQPFDGTIDLFKARTRIYFVDDFKYLGWKKFALKGVKVHEVPGDHKTMLLNPNDKAFARALQHALDTC